VKALILSGADVNARTPSGASALFIASYTGHAACVQVLLEAGADPNAGSRCSECARNRGFPNIAKLCEQRPPGCVRGLVYDPSALFRKWLRRYFFVSLSEGIIIISRNCILPGILHATDPQPSDGAMRMHARDCCFMELENFEGKLFVLKICCRSSEVSFCIWHIRVYHILFI
jgi:hypothetical protein